MPKGVYQGHDVLVEVGLHPVHDLFLLTYDLVIGLTDLRNQEVKHDDHHEELEQHEQSHHPEGNLPADILISHLGHNDVSE